MSASDPAPGLYLYCLAQGSEEEGWGKIGILGGEVQVIPTRGIVAVAQTCPPTPFSSEDKDILADWIRIHGEVVDRAWEKYQTVLPFSFNTIIAPADGGSARERLVTWLSAEEERFLAKLAQLGGKAEYGIQICWDPTVVATRITEKDSEVEKLRGMIACKPSGTAYLLTKQLQELIANRLEIAADAYFKDFYQRISSCAEDITVEKVKKEPPPRQMIANLSCLADEKDIRALGTQLEKIAGLPGIFVKFTGPWPPYSFVKGA